MKGVLNGTQPAYAALAVQTREFVVIVMWAGQWACEGFNWVLKHAIKQERPIGAYTLLTRPCPCKQDLVSRQHWKWLRFSFFPWAVHGLLCLVSSLPLVLSPRVFNDRISLP